MENSNEKAKFGSFEIGAVLFIALLPGILYFLIMWILSVISSNIGLSEATEIINAMLIWMASNWRLVIDYFVFAVAFALGYQIGREKHSSSVATMESTNKLMKSYIDAIGQRPKLYEPTGTPTPMAPGGDMSPINSEQTNTTL